MTQRGPKGEQRRISLRPEHSRQRFMCCRRAYNSFLRWPRQMATFLIFYSPITGARFVRNRY
jgi:hypothetical protein